MLPRHLARSRVSQATASCSTGNPLLSALRSFHHHPASKPRQAASDDGAARDDFDFDAMFDNNARGGGDGVASGSGETANLNDGWTEDEEGGEFWWDASRDMSTLSAGAKAAVAAATTPSHTNTHQHHQDFMSSMATYEEEEGTGAFNGELPPVGHGGPRGVGRGRGSERGLQPPRMEDYMARNEESDVEMALPPQQGEEVAAADDEHFTFDGPEKRTFSGVNLGDDETFTSEIQQSELARQKLRAQEASSRVRTDRLVDFLKANSVQNNLAEQQELAVAQTGKEKFKAAQQKKRGGKATVDKDTKKMKRQHVLPNWRLALLALEENRRAGTSIDGKHIAEVIRTLTRSPAAEVVAPPPKGVDTLSFNNWTAPFSHVSVKTQAPTLLENLKRREQRGADALIADDWSAEEGDDKKVATPSGRSDAQDSAKSATPDRPYSLAYVLSRKLFNYYHKKHEAKNARKSMHALLHCAAVERNWTESLRILEYLVKHDVKAVEDATATESTKVKTLLTTSHLNMALQACSNAQRLDAAEKRAAVGAVRINEPNHGDILFGGDDLNAQVGVMNRRAGFDAPSFALDGKDGGDTTNKSNSLKVQEQSSALANELPAPELENPEISTFQISEAWKHALQSYFAVRTSPVHAKRVTPDQDTVRALTQIVCAADKWREASKLLAICHKSGVEYPPDAYDALVACLYRAQKHDHVVNVMDTTIALRVPVSEGTVRRVLNSCEEVECTGGTTVAQTNPRLIPKSKYFNAAAYIVEQKEMEGDKYPEGPPKMVVGATAEFLNYEAQRPPQSDGSVVATTAEMPTNCWALACKLFNSLAVQGMGLMPQTYESPIRSCCAAGRWDVAMQMVGEMKKDKKVIPPYIVELIIRTRLAHAPHYRAARAIFELSSIGIETSATSAAVNAHYEAQLKWTLSNSYNRRNNRFLQVHREMLGKELPESETVAKLRMISACRLGHYLTALNIFARFLNKMRKDRDLVAYGTEGSLVATYEDYVLEPEVQDELYVACHLAEVAGTDLEHLVPEFKSKLRALRYTTRGRTDADLPLLIKTMQMFQEIDDWRLLDPEYKDHEHWRNERVALAGPDGKTPSLYPERSSTHHFGTGEDHVDGVAAENLPAFLREVDGKLATKSLRKERRKIKKKASKKSMNVDDETFVVDGDAPDML